MLKENAVTSSGATISSETRKYQIHKAAPWDRGHV
jgi:hypothetical protein